MRRVAVLSLFVIGLAHCAGTPMPVKAIEFLTREGCVQTKIMRVRLDEAIEAIGKPIPYTVVDLDSLPANDVRKGYPTPTILRGGVDLFGMAEVKPPYPEPT